MISIPTSTQRRRNVTSVTDVNYIKTSCLTLTWRVLSSTLLVFLRTQFHFSFLAFSLYFYSNFTFPESKLFFCNFFFSVFSFTCVLLETLYWIHATAKLNPVSRLCYFRLWEWQNSLTRFFPLDFLSAKSCPCHSIANIISCKLTFPKFCVMRIDLSKGA